MTDEYAGKSRESGSGAQVVPGRSGFVYFIQCGPDGAPIKIGRTADMAQRLQDLQVGCPFDLLLLSSLFVDDAEQLERGLHHRFAAQRIRGEWFEATYAVRSAAVQMGKLSVRQKAQTQSSGDPVFEWRGVIREAVEMPDPSVLLTTPLGSRHADPRKLRGRGGSGYWWRGKWRSQ
jgi:hypothetical protein